MRNISKTFLLPIATLVVGVIGAISIHQALAGPSAAPPYNNVSSPVNVSAYPQVKKGPLGLGLDLTTDNLGNQLRVKGTTKLEGKTTISGGASISGGATIAGNTTITGYTNVVGDTFSSRFCLPDDKGGCVASWPAASDLTNYCTKNDTRAGCQGVAASGVAGKIVGGGYMIWDAVVQSTSKYCRLDGAYGNVVNNAKCKEEIDFNGLLHKYLECPTGSEMIQIGEDLIWYDPSLVIPNIQSVQILPYPITKGNYVCQSK